MTRHQYVSFSVVRQTSFRGETSDDAVRCQLFSQIEGLLKTDIFTIVSNALKNNLAVNLTPLGIPRAPSPYLHF